MNVDSDFFVRRLAIATLLISTLAAETVAQASDRSHSSGRVPWTTSNVRGRPEPPPPYQADRVYSQLRFKATTFLVGEPGMDRMFVGEQGGKVYVLPRDREATTADLFLDCAQLVDQLNKDNQSPVAFEALYGMTFDPNFAANRTCYVCYVVRGRDQVTQFAEGTRVSRFRVTEADPPRCEIESEELIISWLQGGHNGGCLKFGPDGCLYISTGDGGSAFPPDGLKSGQDLSTLLSKILRIDVRRQEDGRPYAIPTDNPFVGQQGAGFERARGETWAYGLRNPWKMSFDRQSGDLWVGDVGWELWELVYHVHKGDNFGWSVVEGSQPVHAEGKRGPTPIIPATMEIPHTDGASITGGFVYRGQRLPELDGTYVFGDWETRRIWGAKVHDDGTLGERQDLIDPTVRIIDFAEDRAGELYLLDHDDGSIYTLQRAERKTDSHRFPKWLSETGLFRSVESHEVAPGVLPFSINAEQWSDGATAARFLGVPGSGTIQIHPAARAVANSMFTRAVDFPVDSVLTKTLSLEMTDGDPSSRRRIETQLLHFDGREWQAYTYQWNDKQTDASLVDRAGATRQLEIRDARAAGGKRTQTWRFAARAECIRCHNPWSEYTLAFNIPQLNRPLEGGSADTNQIRSLRESGLWVDFGAEPADAPRPLDAPRDPAELPRLAAPFDPSGDLQDRARAYLHANCGHCHRFNGGGSSYLFLQYNLPMRETSTIGARPTQGTFGIHDARILAPGDPYRSVLYFRMAKIGPGHMPHLGAKAVDERGLALVHDWIKQLPARPDDELILKRLLELGESREQRSQDLARLVRELLSTPSRALLLVEKFRSGAFSGADRKFILDTALGSDIDPAVRDLFEAFVPEEQRTQRLGETINPDEILKLQGDVSSGHKLFHESTVVQCRSCHRIAGKGTDVGPDLDGIGKKYDRAKILESILQPSLRIDPEYTTWLVETKSGQVVTGLIVRRDGTEIVLRDAQNKQSRFATVDVENVQPQTKSLMPELLMRDFTARQVADLIDYLATLRREEKEGAKQGQGEGAR